MCMYFVVNKYACILKNAPSCLLFVSSMIFYGLEIVLNRRQFSSTKETTFQYRKELPYGLLLIS